MRCTPQVRCCCCLPRNYRVKWTWVDVEIVRVCLNSYVLRTAGNFFFTVADPPNTEMKIRRISFQMRESSGYLMMVCSE